MPTFLETDLRKKLAEETVFVSAIVLFLFCYEIRKGV